jgi:DNA/RNA endonuclease G (NUC1)
MFARKSRLPLRRTRQQKTNRPALMRTWRLIVIVAVVALVSVYVAFAAISLSTSIAYTQNFDTMGVPLSSPTPLNLPTDFRQDTISAPRTLGSFSSATTQTLRVGGANLSTTAANGSYNFGAGSTSLGNSDRAPGFLSSGTATMSGNLYSQLVNNTGSTLSGLLISYDVEKYRNGLNPAGFRIQLFYSTNGSSWTNAGSDFLTSFAPDADNSGFANAPGATVPVSNKTLNVSIPSGSNFFLAWNYSVNSGSTTTNAPALAIDNVSILGVGTGGSTNPSGVGHANPASVAATNSTLLTVAVTPGTNPTSTAHTVIADLTAIGGSATQQFFDNGTNGDVTAGDNVFSFNATVASGTSGGVKSLPFTITETSPLSRTGTGSISLTVLAATNPSGAGAANPNSVLPGETSVLTVTVTPGSNPPSSALTVTADLSAIGGSASQQFFDDGVNGGDAVAGNNVFTYTATVSSLTTSGAKSLPFSIGDAQSRSGSGSISLTVQQPPPPVDHLVISQLYGGGGNSGATFTNDYVEIYNPTGISFNLAGWSLQYASAAGTSWTNKQPLGGTIAPGEYFLVALASGGGNGSPLPVSPNISGDINMSATTGKLALVSNSISLSGSCPNGIDPDIVDFLGYGSSASCFEGASRAPAPSNTNALFRKLNGAQDTNQNGADFQTGAPSPHRTAPIVELGPWVANTDPISDGFNVPYDATVTVDFSEPVDVTGSWFDITCANSGSHNNATVAVYNSAKGYHITPNTGFQFGEQCTVTIVHTNVHDQDLDDSSPDTDTLFADHSWSFTVVAAGAPAPHSPGVHLTFGNPSNAIADLLQPNNYLMEKPSFTLSYNRDKGTPNWVSWHLETAWTGNLSRNDTFRADPAVSPDWYRVQSTDYFASGFDRGHMTPNADRDNPASIPLNQETFLMSNMVPQAPNNNQGPWADFESFLRTLLATNEVYIIAGPAGVGGSGDNGPATTLANGHVTVPAYTWKVALVLPAGDNDVPRVNAATRTIAVIMPNQNSINGDWHTYLTTVDAVEALTGYDFFANVPDATENAIEAGVDGNNPPGTENQWANTDEDVAAAITLNAVSPNLSPSFTYTIITAPANGVLSGSGPTFTYTPAANFHGSDSFVFRVNDGSHDSNTSTVNITVNAVNDAPVADSQSVTTNSNTAISITLTGSDFETSSANLIFEVTVNPAHGTLSGSGAGWTYSPDANFSGADSFKFTVRDTGDDSAAPLTSSEATVSITVNDTVAPTITAPTNASANTGAGATSCGTVVSDAQLGTATASDNGGGVSIARSGVPAGNIFPVGTTTITYTATDDAGNSTQATQTVTVVDNTAPSVTAPASTSASAGPTGQAAIPDVVAAASASDNCGPLTLSQSPAAGTMVGVGVHTIIITATDSAGNTSTATTTFTVNDTTPPSVTAPASTSASAGPTGQAAIPDVVAAASASDNCGPVTLSQSPAAGTMVGVGVHTITITATDAAGNTSTATTTFTINDTTAPTITAPANVSANTGAGATTCGTLVSDAQLGTATTADNVGGVSIARTGVPAGNVFPVGTTTVTYTATDGSGNSAQATQTVTVVDNTAPSVTAPAPARASTNLSGQAAVPNFLASTVSSDNCGPVTLSQSPIAGTLVGVGQNTITITAIDAAGNTSTTTTTFTVTGGSLNFFISSSGSAPRGKPAKIDIGFINTTGERQWVSYVVRYSSPCGSSAVIESGGPLPVNDGTQRNVNVQFHVPKDACTGLYTLTLETYVNGVFLGAVTSETVVSP